VDAILHSSRWKKRRRNAFIIWKGIILTNEPVKTPPHNSRGAVSVFDALPQPSAAALANVPGRSDSKVPRGAAVATWD